MRIVCQTFSLPKAGREFADCEDAYFPTDGDRSVYREEHDDVPLFRAAVCDGATDSIFSKYWAQLLARDYGTGKLTEEAQADAIAEAQTAWLDFLSKQELPWYAEEKAELGAFAALAGITLLEESRCWKALAIGDSCVFQIRNNECLVAFPIMASARFSNFPYLLNSLVERNGDVFDHKEAITDGQWQPGDVFFLMSDAMACWFLEAVEQQGAQSALIAKLLGVNQLEPFKQLINAERSRVGGNGASAMKDDDVTFLRVTVAQGRSPSTQPAPGAASKNTSYKRFSSEFIKPPEIPPQAAPAKSDAVPLSAGAIAGIHSNIPTVPTSSSGPEPSQGTTNSGNKASSSSPGSRSAKQGPPLMPVIIAVVATVVSIVIGGLCFSMISHSQTKKQTELPAAGIDPAPVVAPVEEHKKTSTVPDPTKHKRRKPTSVFRIAPHSALMPKPAPQRKGAAGVDSSIANPQVPDAIPEGTKPSQQDQPRTEQLEGK